MLDYVRSRRIIPRAWYHSRKIGEREVIDLERTKAGRRHRHFAHALMGASPGESATGLDRELVGSKSRWFGVDDEGDDVCILPVSMAQIVGIDTKGVSTATVGFMGRDWRVIGLIDGDRVD